MVKYTPRSDLAGLVKGESPAASQSNARLGGRREATTQRLAVWYTYATHTQQTTHTQHLRRPLLHIRLLTAVHILRVVLRAWDCSRAFVGFQFVLYVKSFFDHKTFRVFLSPELSCVSFKLVCVCVCFGTLKPDSALCWKRKKNFTCWLWSYFFSSFQRFLLFFIK